MGCGVWVVWTSGFGDYVALGILGARSRRWCQWVIVHVELDNVGMHFVRGSRWRGAWVFCKYLNEGIPSKRVCGGQRHTQGLGLVSILRLTLNPTPLVGHITLALAMQTNIGGGIRVLLRKFPKISGAILGVRKRTSISGSPYFQQLPYCKTPEP